MERLEINSPGTRIIVTPDNRDKIIIETRNPKTLLTAIERVVIENDKKKTHA